MQQSDNSNRQTLMIPILLSFNSAFVDVVCYLGLFRTFTAFITGTLIILAADLFHQDDGFITKIVVVSGFMASLFIWVLVIRRFKSWRHLPPVLLAAEAVFLALFMVAGTGFSPLGHADTPQTILTALFAALAMSLQNALMALVFYSHVPTTVMTGNFTRFAISAIDILGSGVKEAAQDPEASFKSTRQLRHYLYALLAFIVGALVGAAGFIEFGFPALILPVATLTFLAFSQRHD